MSKIKSELKIAFENMMRKQKIQVHLDNLEKSISQKEKEIQRLFRITERLGDDVERDEI